MVIGENFTRKQKNDTGLDGTQHATFFFLKKGKTKLSYIVRIWSKSEQKELNIIMNDINAGFRSS